MFAPLLAAAHGAGAAAAEYGESSGGMPQLDLSTWPSQIFWFAIAFGALYLILSRSLLPKVGAVIEDRQDKIADDLDEAARLQRQADEAEKAYEAALADARARAHAIASETRERVSADLAAETQAAEAEIARKAEEAETRIQAASEAALAQLNAVAADAAGAIVERLSGSEASRSDIEAAVEAVERAS